MKLSVIILTYNATPYLPDLMDSLGKTRWPVNGEHELIFVDNASSDRTLIQLKKYQLPQCRIIANERNLGFAAGNNVGMRAAFKSGAHYVVLLNQDTVVEPDWIQKLLSVAEQFPDSGAVQSLLLYWDQKNVVNSWGNHVHFLGFGFAGGNLEIIDDKRSMPVKEITYASGAAVLYRTAALKKVGLFDEILENYHEDLDIGLRLRMYGYRSYLSPQSIVRHKYKFLKDNVELQGKYKYYLMERNRLYLFFAFYSPKSLFIILPAWLAVEIGLLGFAAKRGFWREKLRGYRWLVGNLVSINKKRSSLRLVDGVSQRTITDDFVSTISYQEIDNPVLQKVGNPFMSVYWKIIKRLI